MIYNPQDDYFYLNGNKTVYRGYQTAIAVFVNGNFSVAVQNGGSVPQSAYGSSYAFNVRDGKLYYNGGAVGTNKHCSVITQEKYDLTNYTYLKANYMGTTYTLTISDKTGEYYIAVEVLYDVYIRLCVTPVNSNWYEASGSKGQQFQVSTISANSYIQEIIVE
jgi:hypothetical protein